MAPYFMKFVSISLVVLLSIVTGTRSELVPALYVFGDSLLDTGNNNYLNLDPFFRSNFANYGVDYPGGKPTGRFSNGLIGPDYLAQLLGFPLGPPSYLSLADKNQMLKGVNFASAGSGILNTTNPGTLNMETQVKNFRNVTKVLKEKLGKNEAEDAIARSLFMFSTANNDIFAYLIGTGANNTASNEKFISHLVDRFIDELTSLHKLGARRFFIFGTGHLGCCPAMRSATPNGTCLEVLNQLSVQFNTAATKRLNELSSKLPGMKYSYVNTYILNSVIFAAPTTFGLADVKNACCGGGKFGGEAGCSANTTYCADRSKFFYWDRYHPTEINSKVTIQLVFDDPQVFTSPMNIRQLATAV